MADSSIGAVEWRFILGDILGRPIANYSAISKDRSLAFRMLRPTVVTMRVPSDHPDVGGTHTDGYPKLDSLRRTLRAYRRERQPDGSLAWKCRAAGVVWNVQDVGDEDSAWTTFSAYSPMQRLSGRFTGTDTADRIADGGLILRDLIDYTNGQPGEAPLGGYTGIATSGYGNVFEATPSRTVRYDRKAIGDAALELAGAYNGFDFDLAPVHQAAGTEDGTLAALSVYARKGGNRPNSVFAWGMATHSAAKIERLLDPSTVANAITGLGGALAGGDAITSGPVGLASSLGDFGRYEAIEAMSDVVTQAFLDSLMMEEAALRATVREVVKITPATSEVGPDGTRRGRVPVPFSDFDLGDTVQAWASPKLRGGFVGLQRVYGFTIALDDNNVERVDQIITSPNDA